MVGDRESAAWVQRSAPTRDGPAWRRVLVTALAALSSGLAGAGGCHQNAATTPPGAAALPDVAALPDAAALPDVATTGTGGAARLASGDAAPVKTDTADPGAASDGVAPADVGPTTPDAARTRTDTATKDITPPSPLTVAGTFIDRWANVGLQLDTSQSNKGKMIEASSSAGAFADLDADGDLDLVLVDGRHKAFVAYTSQPWQWQPKPLVETKEDGLRTICPTDIDGDGVPELALGGQQLLYFVRQKDGSYTSEALARGLKVSNQAGVQHIATADLDNDGLLDLVTAEYSCSDKATVRGYLNRGNGLYGDDTFALALGHKTTAWFVLALDSNGDRQIDLMVGHENCQPAKGNVFYRNKGPNAQGARFESVKVPPVFLAPIAGGATPMGGSAADVDLDGDFDVVLTATGLIDMVAAGTSVAAARKDPSLAAFYLTAMNSLLLAGPAGTYTMAGAEWGLGWAVSTTAKPMTSWSARFFDFDADGWQDVYMTHGHDFQSMLLGDEGGMRPVLFRNLGNGSFDDVSAPFGLPDQHLARALAAADVDGDGDLDFLEGGQGGQPLLLQNGIATPKQWLQVRLKGTTSNVWGVGAIVELATSGATLREMVGASAPTQTQDPMVAHFAVPAVWKAGALTVRWPSGYDQVVPAVKLNQALVVQEPPLVTVSGRFLPITSPTATLVVTARAHDAAGAPQPGITTTIELTGNAKGSWIGPTACQPDGSCQRSWQVPSFGVGGDAVIVAFGGKELATRPVLRFGLAP